MQNKFEKVFMIGTGRVASECLRELKNNGINVIYISEVNSDGFNSTDKLCKNLGITCEKIERSDLKNYLSEITADSLIISAHNSYIFPSEVTNKENLTIINMHIALLPYYRGMNPATWEIFNMEKFAGVTWHKVNEKIDSGTILVQEKIEILDDDTAMNLMLKCFNLGIKLFRENLEAFLSKNFVPVEKTQNEKSRLYLSKELPNKGYMNLNWDLNQAWAFLRSMDYTGADIMPLPRVVIGGREFEITSYRKNLNADMQLSINYEGGGGLTLGLREV